MGILNILYITKFKQNIVYISFFEEKNLFKKICFKSFMFKKFPAMSKYCPKLSFNPFLSSEIGISVENCVHILFITPQTKLVFGLNAKNRLTNLAYFRINVANNFQAKALLTVNSLKGPLKPNILFLKGLNKNAKELSFFHKL